MASPKLQSNGGTREGNHQPALASVNSNLTKEERLEMARKNIGLAMALTGHIYEGNPVCPACNTAESGKVRIFEDGGVKCHKCGFYCGNGIDWITEYGKADDGNKIPFRQALEFLTDPAAAQKAGISADDVNFEPPFRATPNVELYARVLELGDTEEAVRFYGRFHIKPDVVIASRATVITDQRKLLQGLTADFSPQDLLDCGLATEGKRGAYLLVNDQYPVVEPHCLPDGRVSALQFRASEATEIRVNEHKAYKLLRAEAEARGQKYHGEKVKHVPKFMSLSGASVKARCGFGLPRLQQLADEVEETGYRPKIYIVEGFKDVVAARSLGLEAIGLAGAGLKPVEAVAKLLSNFPVRVTLDGDEAGDSARAALTEYLRSWHVDAIEHAPPVGKDIADVLADKVAEKAATQNA